MSDETTNEAAPVKNYTDEHLRLVREFQAVTGADKLAEMTMNQGVLQFRAQFSADGESEVADEMIPPNFREMIRMCEEEHLQAKHILVDIIEQIFANKFTEKELTEILAFCSTDIGKRIVDLGGLRVPDCRSACFAWSLEVHKRFTAKPKFAELANNVGPESDPVAQELEPGAAIEQPQPQP